MWWLFLCFFGGGVWRGVDGRLGSFEDSALIQGVQSLALDFACSEDSASAVLK